MNVHLTTHTQRCFKKRAECYANIPDGISISDMLIYNQEFDLWSDWCGNKEKRFMLRFQPKRLCWNSPKWLCKILTFAKDN